MINIPTELLRTLLAVVDVRSFTKAAHLLGVTQPAVSAQIKRLQLLLGFDLFDKSAPGVSVTEKGDRVVREARRLLAINDEIVALVRAPQGSRTLRFGLPGDFVGGALWKNLALFRNRRPDLRLHMKTGDSLALMNELHQGDLDLVVALSTGKPHQAAVHHWRDELTWIRGPATVLDPAQPVRLVTRGEDCIFHRHMISALDAAARNYEIVFSAANTDDLTRAVAAGFGVTALPRSLAASSGAPLCDDGTLPRLADIMCSVCVRADTDAGARDDLAAIIADTFRPAAQIALGNRPGKVETMEPLAQRAPAA
jgi:DNA-binding transcriptional LysR family regulator